MDKLKEKCTHTRPAPVAILGVPFDVVTTRDTIAIIDDMIVSGRPHYLATANVDFLAQSMRDVELRRILFDSHLVLCDGTPLIWASKLLGNPLPERVAGSDLVPLLLQHCEERGYRPFFLGATPEVMEQAMARVKARHPYLEVAGGYSPPFNRLLEMDHEEICRRITEAEPDLLFVGFGCPKQEKWINMHYRSLGVPVSIGVGGTIDFLSGKLARAPIWMQRTGLEWVFRLAQEPRRLLSRYADDLWHFGWGIAGQYLRLRLRRKPKARSSVPVRQNLDYNLVEMPNRLDSEAVRDEREKIESAMTSEIPCVVRLDKVTFIDSTGIGLLVRLQKKARLDNQPLLLVEPSKTVIRALEMMKLTSFFTMVPDLESARARLRNSSTEGNVQLRAKDSSGFPSLEWHGELTAANADEVWISTRDHISARALIQESFVIDLSSVQFIDSTGLALMIRAKKFGARHGVKVRFIGCGKNVMNVIRLSRLEDYLLSAE
ncbi:MAG: WecB/TagA/CpsF family glycosyltransferase [Verrucomicrobiota bacterium]